MKLQEQVNKYNELLDIATAFVSRYNDCIPENFASLSLSSNMIGLFIHLNWVSDEDRDRGLSLLGDVFGRTGWKGELESAGSSFHTWRKEVDGVKIYIYGAKKLPDVVPQWSVLPTEFPVLLEDRVEMLNTDDIPF